MADGMDVRIESGGIAMEKPMLVLAPATKISYRLGCVLLHHLLFPILHNNKYF